MAEERPLEGQNGPRKKDKKDTYVHLGYRRILVYRLGSDPDAGRTRVFPLMTVGLRKSGVGRENISFPE
jgi:hypothetical protein